MAVHAETSSEPLCTHLLPHTAWCWPCLSVWIGTSAQETHSGIYVYPLCIVGGAILTNEWPVLKVCAGGLLVAATGLLVPLQHQNSCVETRPWVSPSYVFLSVSSRFLLLYLPILPVVLATVFVAVNCNSCCPRCGGWDSPSTGFHECSGWLGLPALLSTSL